MKKLLFIFLSLPILTLGQGTSNLLRSTISNSGGSSEPINKFLVQQSIGQSSPVGVQELSQGAVRQGFIQPSLFKRMIAANNANFLVDIYPNPTTDKITLTFKELVVGKIHLAIFDQMGRLVLESNNESDLEISYSLTDLRVGNYFLKVNTSTQQYVTQITKQQ